MSVTYTNEYIFPTSKLREVLESLEATFINWSQMAFCLPDGKIVGEAQDQEDVFSLNVGDQCLVGQCVLRCGIDESIREAATMVDDPGLENARRSEDDEENHQEEEEGFEDEDEDEDEYNEDDDLETAAWQYGMARANESYDDDDDLEFDDEGGDETLDSTQVEIPLGVCLTIDTQWSRLELQSANDGLINIMAESECFLAETEYITRETAEYFTTNANGALSAKVKGQWVSLPSSVGTDENGNESIDRIVEHIRLLEKP